MLQWIKGIVSESLAYLEKVQDLNTLNLFQILDFNLQEHCFQVLL
jgi:hypothetical protein